MSESPVEVLKLILRFLLLVCSLVVVVLGAALTFTGTILAIVYFALPALFCLAWNVSLFEHPIRWRPKLSKTNLYPRLIIDGIVGAVTTGLAVTFQVKNDGKGDGNLIILTPLFAYSAAAMTFILIVVADGWGWNRKIGRG